MTTKRQGVYVLAVLLLAGQESWAQSSLEPERDNELVDAPSVFLRGLDKVTARIKEFSVKVGETARFGSLEITLRYCRTRPPIEPPESFAYLDIAQMREGMDSEPVFAGWMVASNPAINPLEHPVYDIWVMRCSAVLPSDSPSSR